MVLNATRPECKYGTLFGNTNDDPHEKVVRWFRLVQPRKVTDELTGQAAEILLHRVNLVKRAQCRSR